MPTEPPKDGGGAFPDPSCAEFGMSLRDYFAAAALGSLLTHASSLGVRQEIIAGVAYQYADAMLKVRYAG